MKIANSLTAQLVDFAEDIQKQSFIVSEGIAFLFMRFQHCRKPVSVFTQFNHTTRMNQSVPFNLE